MEIILLTVYVLIWPIIVAGVLWIICSAFLKDWIQARKEGPELDRAFARTLYPASNIPTRTFSRSTPQRQVLIQVRVGDRRALPVAVAAKKLLPDHFDV